MQHHAEAKDKHPKQDFQVERLAFFSDAVFAIAITLLVIEFKVPHITNETTYAEALHGIMELKYEFIAMLLSFALVAIYWLRHHLLFKHIHNYNRPILICSLLVLLPMIFFPFTTALYAQSINNLNVFPIAIQLFLINNIAAGVATYVMFWMVTKRYPEMSYHMSDKDSAVFNNRLLWMTVSMSCMLILSYISLKLVLYGMAPWIAISLYNKLFKKKKVKKHYAR